MITINLLGGAKKALSTDKLKFEKDNSTISELLVFLQTQIPKNTHALDVKNILVAVNGVDSSTLDGFETKIKDGDTVSIIPVIHGGSQRMKFQIFNDNIELIGIKHVDDPIGFLDDLRKKYPDLVIQGIRSCFVLGPNHAKKIIAISRAAQKDRIMLSNKIETDILMRFACTKQISEAIKKIGLQRKQDFILIVIGRKQSLNKLFYEVRTHLKSNLISIKNVVFLKKEFKISKKQLDAVISNTPLEDLLAEKAAILFR
ncbi:MAG TPA: KEOPS complex subunit Cgi121 [Nitrosopumilaceae archaeon]|nr:KEOPS complex subunit Cgi121 [Nitrosopumilaceae archaeon]